MRREGEGERGRKREKEGERGGKRMKEYRFSFVCSGKLFGKIIRRKC